MPRANIYPTARCPTGETTTPLPDKWTIPCEHISLNQERTVLREFSSPIENAGIAPRMLIDERWICGFSELTELHIDAQRDALVENAAQ